MPFEVQHQYSTGHAASWLQATPNHSFQRTQQSVTPFASSKAVPLCRAAELRRYTLREILFPTNEKIDNEKKSKLSCLDNFNANVIDK